VTQLGGAQYTPGTGDWQGDDMAAAASQLQSGDTARADLTFPFDVSFLPGDAIAAVLGPVFGLAGHQLLGVDISGSTISLTFTV
jgi:hypothetical protein